MSHHYGRRTRKPTNRCTVCDAEIPTALAADPLECPVARESIAAFNRMVAGVEAGMLPFITAVQRTGTALADVEPPDQLE